MLAHHKCLASLSISARTLGSQSISARTLAKNCLPCARVNLLTHCPTYYTQYRRCSQLSGESPDFASFAAKLPKSYAAHGAKTAEELGSKFGISLDGLIVKNEKAVDIKAKDLLDFLVTSRKTSLNSENIKEIVEELSMLKSTLRPNARKVINEAKFTSEVTAKEMKDGNIVDSKATIGGQKRISERPKKETFKSASENI